MAAAPKKKTVTRVPAAVPMRAAVRRGQAVVRETTSKLMEKSGQKTRYWPSKSTPKRIEMPPEYTAYGKKKTTTKKGK